MSSLKSTASELSPAILDEMVGTLSAIKARHAEKTAAELKYPETRDTPEEREYIDKSMRLMREQQAEIDALVSSWTRSQQEAVLKHRLLQGAEVRLELTDDWLQRLIVSHPARVLEAQRLKEQHINQLSPLQLSAVREEGDSYWLRLAQSYQGSA